jgi:hypothetical protein
LQEEENKILAEKEAAKRAELEKYDTSDPLQGEGSRFVFQR